MYAVIKAGGKQQRVEVGDVIEVERTLAGKDGRVTFHPIMVVEDDGTTHVGKDAQKAVVITKALGEQKGEKVKVLHYRPKTGYTRNRGHRQLMTLLEVEDVKLGTAEKVPAKKAAPKPPSDASAEAPGAEGEE